MDDTVGKESTSLDRLFGRVGVLVNLVQTGLGVPQQAHTKRSRCRQHAVVLVLVDPRVAFGCIDHELVVTETSIDESVDKGAGQVATSRVNRAAETGACVFEMGLVNVLEALWLKDVELLAKVDEVTREMRVVHDVEKLVVGDGESSSWSHSMGMCCLASM